MASAGDLFGGGGVSELDLVAGENLTVGDLVSLGIDGKAYKSIGLSNNSSVASPLPLATTTRYLLDTVASKIIALGVSTVTNTALYTSVGNVSASGALTWGAVTTHTMGSTIGISTASWDAIRQSNNQLMLVYTDNSLPPYIRARIIQYSGTTTTVGTEVTTTATNVTNNPVINLVADSTGRVLIAWFRNTSNFTLWGARATVSGTTITLGAETQITLTSAPASNTNQRLEMLYDATQDRAVIFANYQYASTSYGTDLVSVNFSSTVSTVSTSAQGNFASPSGNLRGALSRVSGTSSYLVRRCLSNTTTSARIVTITTTAFTLGIEVTLSQNANGIDNANWVEDTVNNKIIFGYDSNGCQVFTRSGTTLTLEKTDTDIDFTSSIMNFFSPYVVGAFSSLQQIYDFSGAIPRAVGTLDINTTALTSQARLLTATSGITYSIEREAGAKLGSSIQRHLIARKLTNENQIGVSTQTVSAAATVRVRLRFNKTTPAKIVTGLSGLTPGVHYYTSTSGARDVAGVTYLGYAKSATELVLANPDGAET
jgi:hypothetical protein